MGGWQTEGMSQDRVTITVTDHVADVRLVRTDKRNALDAAMFTALAEAGETVKKTPGVRAVVISGDGQSFCAGLDFEMITALASGQPTKETPAAGTIMDTSDRITHLGQQVAWVWQEVPVPVIAAVHGHALGGGIQLALGADIRFVHPDTQLSVREVHWGLVPDMTGTFMLAQVVGADVAKELVFTARMFDGREAYRIGVATHLTERPYDDAMALAREIAGRNPDAVRAAKALMNGMLNTGAAEQFAAERRSISSLIGTPNQAEAVVSNLEKRPGRFVDPA